MPSRICMMLVSGQSCEVCGSSVDEFSVCVGGMLHLGTDNITAFVTVLFINFIPTTSHHFLWISVLFIRKIWQYQHWVLENFHFSFRVSQIISIHHFIFSTWKLFSQMLLIYSCYFTVELHVQHGTVVLQGPCSTILSLISPCCTAGPEHHGRDVWIMTLDAQPSLLYIKGNNTGVWRISSLEKHSHIPDLKCLFSWHLIISQMCHMCHSPYLFHITPVYYSLGLNFVLFAKHK